MVALNIISWVIGLVLFFYLYYKLKQPLQLTVDAVNPPCKVRPSDAAYDLVASDNIIIQPNTTVIVPTYHKISIPEGYEGQVRGRSGLAAKHSIWVHVGTIDPGYIGNIGVIIHNLGSTPYLVEFGDRIGQLIINKVEDVQWNDTQRLKATERGEAGYGSSGKSAVIINSTGATIVQ